MRKLISVFMILLLTVTFSGCGKDNSVTTKNTIKGNLRTYYEMSDGTWVCDDFVYKYRLEISGKMSGAAVDSTFVYLSNLEEISFEQAAKAAGLSSSTDDYFQPEDAVLVEWQTN